MRTAVLLGFLILAACKGDRQKCETACRNYGTLLYWDITTKDIAAAPADQRDALHKKKLGEFSAKLEEGVDLCVNQCVSANNDKQTDCMIEAKTADAQRKCVE